MRKNTSHNGYAIPLAWPQTLCKQPGVWYDAVLYYLGLNVRGYYKVGHAAVVLVDDETGTCRYFDFGRYHAPHGHGRVRSAKTDHDLHIRTRATLDSSRKTISNTEEILAELYANPSTHGDGAIYGSLIRVNVNAAADYARQLQRKTFLRYGPFLPGGTNCSRFVNDVIKAGNPTISCYMMLQFPLTLSPTPIWNVRAGGKMYCVQQPEEYSRNSLIATKIPMPS